MKTMHSCLLLAAAALLGGCASHSSRIDGERYFRAPIDTYPVIVAKVDGESTPIRIPTFVEPGRHTITVQAYPTGAQRFGETRTIELEVAPCTRYWLVAVKPNALATDFEVKVDHSEPIAGCTPPKT